MQATVPRPPLTQSYSFSAATTSGLGISSSGDVPTRPPQRRVTSMSDYVASHALFARSHAQAPPPSTPIQDLFAPSQTMMTLPRSGPASSLIAQQNPRNQAPNMDPTPDDPDATFLHPPFLEFTGPNFPEGLTYTIMLEHPEWFLDANDYKSATNDSPSAVAYPAQLEPPRGWCPGKKKELKQLGADGWPEGEEPRLRCTFCRRTYAGVNAKSMWRRHVYEKHRIAMANRRDGTERVRGRQSNKENKKAAEKALAENTTSGASGSGYTEPMAGSSSGSRSLPTATLMQPPTTYTAMAIRSGKISMDAVLDSIHSRPRSRHQRRATTPPPPDRPAYSAPEPQLESPLETEPAPEEPIDDFLTHDPVTSTPARAPLPPVYHEEVYNPNATPMFRHSPQRITNLPWKYEPNHPLYQNPSDVILGGIGQGDFSPLLKTPKDMSPFSFLKATPGSSPSLNIFGDKPHSTSDYGIFNPMSTERMSPWTKFNRTTPRKLFGNTPLREFSRPAFDTNIDFNSSFSGDSSGVFSDIDSSWGSSGSKPLLGTPIKLAGDKKDSNSSPGVMDSPVLRRTLTLGADPVGLKAGSLMADDLDDQDEDGSVGDLRYPEVDSASSDEEEGDDIFSAVQHDAPAIEDTRSTKRRKISA